MSASTTPAPEPAGAGDPLRDLLRQRIARATAEAETDGAPSEQAVAEIKRLEELLRARDAMRPPSKRSAVPTVLVAVVIALLVGALLALRMPTTEATLALDLSSLAFRTAPGQGQGALAEVYLTDWTTLAALSVDELALERPGSLPEMRQVEIHGGSGEPVSLRPISLPVGTWVRVDAPAEDGSVAVELTHPTLPLELRVDLQAGAGIDPPELAEGLDPSLPAQSLLLRAVPDSEGGACAQLVMRLLPFSTSEVQGGAGISLVSGLTVDALLFSRLDPDRSGSLPASTLLGGSLAFDEVGGAPMALQRGQRLELVLAAADHHSRPMRLLRGFGGAIGSWLGIMRPGGVPLACRSGTLPEPLPAAGRIDRIELVPGMVRVAAEATVARADAGVRSGPRPLKPTMLEWLRAWPEIPLYWGTLVTLCTLAWTGLSWWRGGR